MVLYGCHGFSVVLIGSSGSRRLSMVLCCSSRRFSSAFNGSCMISMVLSVLVASQWFSVVLTCSRRFSVLRVGSQCSRWFSMVLSGSRRF